ncbi:MAG: biotin/lipoyl-containing protein [Candidatus Eremiobacterota bacterium]
MRIVVPREDVNDDTAVLGRWLAADGEMVEAGQAVCELETSKTVYDVVSPAGGILHHRAETGQELPVGGLLGFVGDPDAVEPEPPPAPERPALKLTREAERFVQEHALDLSSLRPRGIVTLADVQALVPRPAVPPKSVPRVLLLGAGSVGMQVLDILLHDPGVQVVGLLDDDPSKTECFGVKVVGKLSDFEPLHRDGFFDQAMITLGLDLTKKRLHYDRCKELGIPLANAVDPTARINRRAVIGEGNVLCSFVHVGVDAVLGDNNFIAAHSSIDHHCRIGSHTLLGPGCLLSGRVSVGDQCLFGSGIVIQPNLSVGDGCLVASGSVILRDVPDHHAVRIRISQEVSRLR